MAKKKSKGLMTEKHMEQRDIFDRYANKYDIDQEPTNEKQKRIDCEWYVYRKMHEKNIQNTNIENLLRITIEECREQYGMKQSFETRVGLITALWGVLVSVLIQTDIPMQNISVVINSENIVIWRMIAGMSLLGQLVFGISSAWFIYKSIGTYGYSTVSLRDKERNFKAAVDDRYISIVQLLDSYSNRFRDNSVALKRKGKYYKKLMNSIVWFSAFVIMGYIGTYTYN